MIDDSQAYLWNVFHDGTIAKVSGIVPGTLNLTIECEYIREMFPGAGYYFTVKLSCCTRFEFLPYEDQSNSDLTAIEQLQLEILSYEMRDEDVAVCSCSRHDGGTLYLRYDRAEVWLDGETPVTSLQLCDAANRYWTEWSQNNKRDRTNGIG